MGRKGILTQAMIDKRRQMHKGSRFPYAFDFMIQDNKQLNSELTVFSHEEIARKTDIMPAAHSGKMTQTSTHYNHESKI